MMTVVSTTRKGKRAGSWLSDVRVDGRIVLKVQTQELEEVPALGGVLGWLTHEGVFLIKEEAPALGGVRAPALVQSEAQLPKPLPRVMVSDRPK